MEPPTFKLNAYQCFESPTATILFYQNVYEEGKQAGLEILQQGQRIAGNGNLRLSSAPGQWDARPENGIPHASPDGSSLEVMCKYAQADIQYSVRLVPEGKSLRLIVDLERPLQDEWIGKASFNLELIPHRFIGKSYSLDGVVGTFPRNYNKSIQQGAKNSTDISAPFAVGRKLAITPEDPATFLSIDAISGEIALLDGRSDAENGWFVVRSLLHAGKFSPAVEWLITPAPDGNWIRPPIICYSQVGYHTHQRKRVALELSPLVSQPKTIQLIRIKEDGSLLPVKSSQPSWWGDYLSFGYAHFDFSEIAEPGMYRLEYDHQATAPFPIGDHVYQDGIWQPTLDTFFPVQMCHMEVRDGYRVWHGACHLDDALQAPPNHKHFDGYTQYSSTDTSYAALTHIPHLNSGGWHDAGDYDLAAGSQVITTRRLAHIRELFHIDRDQMAVDRTHRKVTLMNPDGIPDLIQQVTHGVENLLSGYRACGHSFSGIIENSLPQYVHLGDPVTMTDNLVREGEHSDDRWAFTNHDTALEYAVCSALAAAYRVLRGWENPLAEECLTTAMKIWLYEKSNPVKTARSAYVPGRPELQAVIAGAELLLATGEDCYRQFLLEKSNLILETVNITGWSVAMVLPMLNEPAFTDQFREQVTNYFQQLVSDADLNPFGVPYSADTWRKQAPIWGVAWNLLSKAADLYYLYRAFPDLINPQIILDTVSYVLGCHPISNTSLVSGVGPRSFTIAYGINRADWTHIPGGVISGPALLRPNYLELQEPFPFLWQQTEYVIGGAANYIFCVLAADSVLSDLA